MIDVSFIGIEEVITMSREYDEFDTGKYNEIAMSYVRLAVSNLVEEGVLEDEQARAVRNEVSYLFDTLKSREV